MSTISASTTSTTALVYTADTTGTLVLQTGSTPTTAVTIGTDQNITTTGNIRLNNGAADGAQLILASSGFSDWNIDNFSGRFRWYYNTTEYMTLDASGNLGVGTSSPATQVHVNGNSDSYFTAGYRVNRYSTAGQYGTINYANGTFNIVATDTALSSPAITFRTSTDGSTATERARITSSGGLWVGTSTRQSTSNSAFIQTTAGDWTANFQCNTSTASSNLGALIYYSASAPNGLSAPFLQCSDNAQNRLIIYSNGTVNNWTGGYAAFSDIKLKENIVDTTPKLEKLMQVRIRNYNLIGDDTKMLGVVAQELESVFPNMIDELPDYEEVTTINEDGNETTERVATGTTTKSVKYSIFVPMLIKAIQEQQALITTLTERITALENK